MSIIMYCTSYVDNDQMIDAVIGYQMNYIVILMCQMNDWYGKSVRYDP